MLADVCQNSGPAVKAIAREAHTLQEQERLRGRSLDVKSIARFGQRRDAVLNQSFSIMKERMSPVGWEALTRYIREIQEGTTGRRLR